MTRRKGAGGEGQIGDQARAGGRAMTAAKRTKTRRAGTGEKVPIVLNLGPIPEENLDAAARVLARIAVDKALKVLGLDRGRTFGDNGHNQHKSGPAGASNTDRAEEQVT